MEHFTYKAYITLYHDIPADFRDCLFFPSVAGEKTFEAAIAPYGDPFENKTGAFTSEEEARINYAEYINPAQTLLTISIADPKGRAFPAYPEGISRRIDNMRRVTLIRVEVNGIYGEVARSDVFFFNVTAANVIYNGEEAPTSIQSAALAYMVEPNIWASALARDTVFYTGAAASAGLNALAVKGGILRNVSPSLMGHIDTESGAATSVFVGNATPRIKGIGDGDGSYGGRYRKKFFNNGSETPSKMLLCLCATIMPKSGQGTAGDMFFIPPAGNESINNIPVFIAAFTQAKEVDRETTINDTTIKESYTLQIKNIFIIPYKFVGLSNDEQIPAEWVPDGAGTEWTVKTASGFSVGARRLFPANLFSLSPLQKFAVDSDTQAEIVSTFGKNLPFYRLTVGTLFNRITAPQVVYADNVYTFGAYTETYFEPNDATIKIYLNAFGERVDITNDFEIQPVISTDTQVIAQQKLSRTVSIIQSLGGTAISGATIAAGLGTGNAVAAIGGAVSLVGQVGNIARLSTEQIKPTVSSTGSGEGTLNAFAFDGLFFEITKYQNYSEIARDTVARGFETEINIKERGAAFTLFSNDSTTEFLTVQNAKVSAGVLSPEAAEFIKTRLENGVKIIKTFDELKKHIGV